MTDLDWFDFQFQWASGIQSICFEAHSQVYAMSGYWHLGSKVEANSTELSGSNFESKAWPNFIGLKKNQYYNYGVCQFMNNVKIITWSS